MNNRVKDTPRKQILNLLCLVVSAWSVDKDAYVDGQDCEQDTDEGHGSELVDELDPDEDDGAHDDEEDRPVHTEVVELHKTVADLRTEQGHRGTHDICLQKDESINIDSKPCKSPILKI